MRASAGAGAGDATGVLAVTLAVGALDADRARAVLAQGDADFAAQDRAGFVLDQEQAAVALGVDVEGAQGDQLADQAAPVGGGVGRADAEGAQPVVAVAQHALGLFAAQDGTMCAAPKIWLVR